MRYYNGIYFSYLCLNLLFVFQVYDGKGTLEEGETAEARFIKIQAAYELLIDVEKRMQYDKDNRVNPMKVRYVICILITVSNYQFRIRLIMYILISLLKNFYLIVSVQLRNAQVIFQFLNITN